RPAPRQDASRSDLHHVREPARLGETGRIHEARALGGRGAGSEETRGDEPARAEKVPHGRRPPCGAEAPRPGSYPTLRARAPRQRTGRRAAAAGAPPYVASPKPRIG